MEMNLSRGKRGPTVVAERWWVYRSRRSSKVSVHGFWSVYGVFVESSQSGEISELTDP